MADFKLHDETTAPEKARPMLEGAKKKLGFIPNLYGVMAGSPATLEAYFSLSAIFDKTSFSPVERQVVLLSISHENDCDYCMAAHSAIAQMQDVPAPVIEALRSGKTISDPKLEALHRFAVKVVDSRGRPGEKHIEAFREAGFTQAQVLEVLVGVAMKTLSNYTNHIAATPLDTAFEAHRWEKND